MRSRFSRSILGVVLLASVLSRAEKPRVVVLDFTASSDALKRTASSVAEQVLTELARTNEVEVLGASDVAALLGQERQRQLLGCSEGGSSCMAEISAAMGAPWLVSGNLAQLGKVTRLDIKLIRAADGKVVLREGKSLTDESEIFELVNAIVGRMLTVMEVKSTAPPAPLSGSGAGAGAGPWFLVGAGAAAAVAGGVLILVGASSRDVTLKALSTPDPIPAGLDVPDFTRAQADLRQSYVLIETGGILAGVGVAAIAGGLTWKLLSPAKQTVTTITFVPGPAALSVRGEF